MENCKICSNKVKFAFDTLIMNKHVASFYLCPKCGFLSCENVHWLESAYKNPIGENDWGILKRNIFMWYFTSNFIYDYMDCDAKFLDWAGGYGIFTRLMRDLGYDFSMCDKYCQNLFGKDFEYKENQEVQMISCFECFEHFEDPISEFEKMLAISKNILFTTNLISKKIPKPDSWNYYAFEGGQHISFYSKKTLKYMAKKYGLKYYNSGNIHFFSEKKINPVVFKLRTKNYRLKCLLAGKFLKSRPMNI